MIPRRLRSKRHSPYLLRVLELRRDMQAMRSGIGERMAEAFRGLDWQAMADANTDLLRHFQRRTSE